MDRNLISLLSSGGEHVDRQLLTALKRSKPRVCSEFRKHKPRKARELATYCVYVMSTLT